MHHHGMDLRLGHALGQPSAARAAHAARRAGLVARLIDVTSGSEEERALLEEIARLDLHLREAGPFARTQRDGVIRAQNIWRASGT